jgi:prevent-host-death family protein
MTRVGVRELRQRASELLRLVERGETIEITDHGRPVAVLAPLSHATGLAELRETGQVEAASFGINGLPDPLEVPADGPSASDVLTALRRRER